MSRGVRRPGRAAQGPAVAHAARGPPLYPDGELTDEPEEAHRRRADPRGGARGRPRRAAALDRRGGRGDGAARGPARRQAAARRARQPLRGAVLPEGHRDRPRRGPAAGGRHGRAQEIEAMLGTPVYLDLHVKIAKDWQRDPRQLRRLGLRPTATEAPLPYAAGTWQAAPDHDARERIVRRALVKRAKGAGAHGVRARPGPGWWTPPRSGWPADPGSACRPTVWSPAPTTASRRRQGGHVILLDAILDMARTAAAAWTWVTPSPATERRGGDGQWLQARKACSGDGDPQPASRWSRLQGVAAQYLTRRTSTRRQRILVTACNGVEVWCLTHQLPVSRW